MNKDILIDLIKTSGLKHIENELIQSVKSSIITNASKVVEAEIRIGQSKLGGNPDVPASFNWPVNHKDVPLAFLAQLNLTDVSNFDIDKDLPSTGMLYFFYESEEQTWGFDIKDRGNWKVLFYDSNLNLKRIEGPQNLPENSMFSTCSLAFELDFTLPPWESIFIEQLKLNSDELDLYFNLLEKLTEIKDPDLYNRILGYPDQIQGEMQLECQLVSNGLYCGDSTGYNDPRRKDLEKGATNWKLLFQLDSVEDTGMMWGDDGRLYFWIEEGALKKHNFDNVWMILQCF